jgi:hypothetical protein
MSVELAGTVALLFVLTALGVSVGLALLGAGMVGVTLLVGADKLAPLMGNGITHAVTSYAAVCAILLIVIGALLEHVGAVLDLPARPDDRHADPDRAAWFAGGTFGVPLPVAASLVFVGLVTETSIARLTVAALLPGLALSALYLLLFGLSRLVRPAPLELGAGPQPERGGDGRVLAIVFRCAVPVVGTLLFVAPIRSGVLTPTEAAGLVVVIGLIFALVLMLVSRRAQAGAWPGLSAGVSAAAIFLLILVGLALFGQLLAFGGVPQALAKAVTPLGLDGRALLGAAAVAALVAGTILGPLAAVGLAAPLAFGLVTTAGVNPIVIGVVLFLTAEAVRVGPRLWRGGFLGSWPNYLAALAVTAGYIVLFA